QHQRVELDDIARLEIFGALGRDQLCACGYDRHPRAEAHRHLDVASGGKRAEGEWPQPMILGEYKLGRHDILAEGWHMLPGCNRGEDLDLVFIQSLHMLSHDHRVCVCRQWITSINPDGLLADRQPSWATLGRADRVGSTDGHTIHSRCVVMR